jgi:hypothetical protein
LEIANNRFQAVKKAIADGGYQGHGTADAVQQKAGILLEIVKRSDVVRVLAYCRSAGSLSALMACLAAAGA